MKSLTPTLAKLFVPIGILIMSASSFAQVPPPPPPPPPVNCPPGGFSPDGKNCIPAGPGLFAPGGSAKNPTPCAPGTFSPGGLPSCTPAAVGYFVPGSGMPSQMICQPGTTTTATGQTACIPIPSGNISSRKPATQSSEDSGGAAGRAVDGNLDGNYGSNSVTHTKNGPNEFWMVNLQGLYRISEIKISNRTDCCSDRIVGATVQVLDPGGQVTWSTQITANQRVYQFAVPNSPGGYVRVLNKPGQYLSLAEVEVLGVRM